MTYIKSFLLALLLVFVVACSDSKPDKLVTSFTNDLNTSTLATDRVSQIRVYANYDDGTSEEITDTLIWSSSDKSIATVSNGLVQTYNLAGDVDIKYETSTEKDDGTAMYEEILSLSVKNLVLKKITLSKSSLSLVVGESSDVYAEGTFEDNVTLEQTTQDITSDATWSSEDNNVSSVLVTNSKAVVKGIAEGNTTIIVSDSDINATLAVEVTKTTYTSVEIFSDKTTFNVDQTIELEARGTTNKGVVVVLDNSDVTWSSSSSVVTLDSSTAIARAIAKGDSTITATITGTNTSDTLVLSVDKENYVRLFRGEVEVDFPYVASETNTTLPTTLGSFTLRVVGVDFTIMSLNIYNFAGQEISSGTTYFNGLELGDVITPNDGNISFTLERATLQTKLHYFFDVNDSGGSSFSQKYEETN